jgi:hypothetical protein
MSRRGFLASGAAGLAVAGVALTVPGQIAGASTLPAKSLAGEGPLATGALTEPLIAHVRDLSSGEISLFSGEREITIHDRHLASRLASATGGR